MKDVVVLIDREQGGRANLAAKGLVLHSAFTLSFILETLVRYAEEGRLARFQACRER